MTRKKDVFNNLEQMKQLEREIEKAGITSVKPLAQRLAKLSRRTFALLAMEAFENE